MRVGCLSEMGLPTGPHQHRRAVMYEVELEGFTIGYVDGDHFHPGIGLSIGAEQFKSWVGMPIAIAEPKGLIEITVPARTYRMYRGDWEHLMRFGRSNAPFISVKIH